MRGCGGAGGERRDTAKHPRKLSITRLKKFRNIGMVYANG